MLLFTGLFPKRMQGYKMFMIFSTLKGLFEMISAKLTKFNPKPNLAQ